MLSSSGAQLHPLLPGTGSGGEVSLLSPGSPVPQVGKAGPLSVAHSDLVAAAVPHALRDVRRSEAQGNPNMKTPPIFLLQAKAIREGN